MYEYQTSMRRIAAYRAIQSRYDRTVARVAVRFCAALKPFERPAMMMLVASRLTSHSQGAGSVSSKSLASNTRRRSGDAKMPKLERCASPLACTMMSVRGVVDRSKAITAGVPR